MNSYPIFSRSFVENALRKMAKYRVKWVSQGFRDQYGLQKLQLEEAVAQA